MRPHMGSIARMDPKLPSKCWDVSWPSPPTPSSKSFFSKVIGLNPPTPPLNKASDLSLKSRNDNSNLIKLLYCLLIIVYSPLNKASDLSLKSRNENSNRMKHKCY